MAAVSYHILSERRSLRSGGHQAELCFVLISAALYNGLVTQQKRYFTHVQNHKRINLCCGGRTKLYERNCTCLHATDQGIRDVEGNLE